MTPNDTPRRWCPDTNVLAHILVASPEGAAYRAVIAQGDLVIPLTVLQELQRRRWSERQLEQIDQFVAEAIVPKDGTEAEDVGKVREVRDRLGLQQGVGEADLGIIAVAGAIGAVFVSHDRSAVRVARAAGVAYYTGLRGIQRAFALDDRALARARRQGGQQA